MSSDTEAAASKSPHAVDGMRIGRGFLGRNVFLFLVASLVCFGFYTALSLRYFTQSNASLLSIFDRSPSAPKAVKRTINVRPSDRPIVIYDTTLINSKAKIGYEPFQHCSFKNCFLSTSDDHGNHADAVVFSDTTALHLPVPRPKDQIWILRLLESPEHSMSLHLFDNQVNYTASYRSDADFHAPYGVFRRSPRRNSLDNSFFGKSRMVAWFVSNCFTKNDRINYVRELNRYIKVDIYGSCSGRPLAKKKGDRLLREEYRFYLAFENSNCQEYITEKLWERAFKNSLIPVVMGAPRSDYEKWAPPNSFIHVDDYKNAAELAKYLHTVALDEELYNSYFKWKSIGYLVDSGFHCNLCEKLQVPEEKVYNDLDSWWFREGQCEAPKVVFTF